MKTEIPEHNCVLDCDSAESSSLKEEWLIIDWRKIFAYHVAKRVIANDDENKEDVLGVLYAGH